ncbi:25162_t:CDS:1, partial [Dentiscutata erythropus]
LGDFTPLCRMIIKILITIEKIRAVIAIFIREKIEWYNPGFTSIK